MRIILRNLNKTNTGRKASTVRGSFALLTQRPLVVFFFFKAENHEGIHFQEFRMNFINMIRLFISRRPPPAARRPPPAVRLPPSAAGRINHPVTCHSELLINEFLSSPSARGRLAPAEGGRPREHYYYYWSNKSVVVCSPIYYCSDCFS
ncbi:hypothetical protein EVAR_26852_1 [Eumeta japonica]|uniref:Uncharacterized protein n=1 Tax=Eumeta variegata TaxID=151549 RepID=A0A4C1VZB0_EUMVA|nr:hypothetical protein EVAR_26852_1 [Eumeta japonica]